MAERVCVFGATGLLGQAIVKARVPLGGMIARSGSEIDIRNYHRVGECIAGFKPELIVNCAGHTLVDQAEQEPDLAHAINVNGTYNLAEAAKHAGARLQYFSTDYVFSGEKRAPYVETDQTDPVNQYGLSKLRGELTLYGRPAQIIRSAWLFGHGKKNFVTTMLGLFAKPGTVRVVYDQMGSPTFTRDLAEASIQLAGRGKNETYHLVNAGPASWYEFAVRIYNLADELGFPVKCDRLVPVPTAEYPRPAKRPAYSVLDTQKARALGITLRGWQEALREYMTELAEAREAPAAG